MKASRLKLSHTLRKAINCFPDTDALSLVDAVDLMASLVLIDDSACDDILASIKSGSQKLVLGWDFNNELKFVMQPIPDFARGGEE